MPDPIIKEEAQEEEEASETNALEMSDEDFMNQPIPEEKEEAVIEEEESDEQEGAAGGEEPEQNAEESSEDADESEEEGKVEEDNKADGETDTKNIGGDTAEQVKEGEEKSSEIDYKAEHEALFAPFRANGKEMKVNSTDDIRRLMEMGANYNKKMAGLKPNLKLLKMLENNDLLDEGKLSYLIDLDKKNPGAINKIIKDSGIDPLDIDTDKDTEYKPNTYTVDDSQVDLDGVLDDIRDTSSFQDTIDIISNKWDESSKEVLLKQPNIIKVINDQVSSGIYGQISQVVESERMLGRLEGLSDLEAYKTVGDAIQARQGFAGQKQQLAQANEQAPTQPESKPEEDPKLKSRRKAASPAKSVKSSNKKPADFNPLSLSDEEFEKISASQYM